MIDAVDVVRVAVGHGVPGAGLRAALGGEVPTLSREVIDLARRHRVIGLLSTAVGDGAVHADDEQGAALAAAWAASLRTCLIAEEACVLAVDAMGAAGVEARVLKGIAVAHLDHDDPAERVFGDADVLIRRDDYRVALVQLERAGFVRSHPPVRGWWEQRFGKAVVLRAPNGAELDLHLSITGGYFGTRIDHDELWSASSRPFDLGGRPVRGLDVEGRFLHACCHSVLGGGSGLRGVRDIAQTLLISGADWRAVLERAERDRVELVLAAAVREAWTELGLDPGHDLVTWATTHVPDEVQARSFAGYREAFDAGWAPEGRSVLAALGPLDRVRFVAGLAVPSRASLRTRGRTWREHLRRGRSWVRGQR